MRRAIVFTLSCWGPLVLRAALFERQFGEVGLSTQTEFVCYEDSPHNAGMESFSEIGSDHSRVSSRNNSSMATLATGHPVAPATDHHAARDPTFSALWPASMFPPPTDATNQPLDWTTYKLLIRNVPEAASRPLPAFRCPRRFFRNAGRWTGSRVPRAARRTKTPGPPPAASGAG